MFQNIVPCSDSVFWSCTDRVFWGHLGENAVFRGWPLRGRPGTLGIPRGVPKKHGRNTTKNTIGTRNDVSKHAFRDQLRLKLKLKFPRQKSTVSRIAAAVAELSPRRTHLAGSRPKFPQRNATQKPDLDIHSVGLGTRVRNTDLVFR